MNPKVAFHVGLGVRNLPANTRGARDAGLIPGLEDSLEQGMATHSSILAWKIHGQRTPAGHSPWAAKSWIVTEHTHITPLIVTVKHILVSLWRLFLDNMAYQMLTETPLVWHNPTC